MATANDRAVLRAILNPDSPLGDVPAPDQDQDTQEDEGEVVPRGCQDTRAGEWVPLPGVAVWPRAPLRAAAEEPFAPALLEQVRDLELQGVSAAESGDVSVALERFGEAIRLLPERASGYNNRAQALRLCGDVTGERCRGGWVMGGPATPLSTPNPPDPSVPARSPAGPGHGHSPEPGPRPRRLPELRAARADPPAAGAPGGRPARLGAGGAAGQPLRPAAAGAAQPLLRALQPDARPDAGAAAQPQRHRQRVRRAGAGQPPAGARGTGSTEALWLCLGSAPPPINLPVSLVLGLCLQHFSGYGAIPARAGHGLSRVRS